jgi:hypothetical protein
MADTNRENVLETIAGVITPYLGQGMARSAVTAHAQKLGVDGPRITPEQVETLMGKIGAGLNIFVGREKSAAILEEVRQVLAGAVRA